MLFRKTKGDLFLPVFEEEDFFPNPLFFPMGEDDVKVKASENFFIGLYDVFAVFLPLDEEAYRAILVLNPLCLSE